MSIFGENTDFFIGSLLMIVVLFVALGWLIYWVLEAGDE